MLVYACNSCFFFIFGAFHFKYLGFCFLYHIIISYESKYLENKLQSFGNCFRQVWLKCRYTTVICVYIITGIGLEHKQLL